MENKLERGTDLDEGGSKMLANEFCDVPLAVGSQDCFVVVWF